MKDGTSVIRFGLGAVKNVGLGPVQIIMDARIESEFSNINEFIKAVDLRAVGKRALESMVRVGALDRLGKRRAILESLDRLVAVSSSHFRAAESGQMSIFGLVEHVTEDISLPNVKELNPRELLEWEKELIGMYVSSHPLTAYREFLRKNASHSSAELGNVNQKGSVTIAGMVSRFRKHLTKNGNDMAFVTLDDLSGSMDVVVFPQVWNSSRDIIEIDKILIINGKVDSASGDPKILADSIRTATEDELSAVMEQNDRAPVVEEVEAVDLSSRYDIVFGGDDQPAFDSIKQAEKKPEPVVEKMAAGVYMGFDDFEDEIDPFFDPSFLESMEYLSEEDEPEAEQPATTAEPLEELILEEKPVAFPPETQTKVVVEEIVETPAEIIQEPDSIQQQNRLFKQARNVAMADTPLSDEPSPVKKAPVIPLNIENILVSKDPSKDEFRMVTIILRANQKGTEQSLMRMKRIVRIMKSYPGRDKFGLMIFENGERISIEFPNDTTGYCPELMRRLKEMVGEDNVQVKTLRVH